MMTYQDFLQSKTQANQSDGLDLTWQPWQLFDFQAHLVEWALHKGRAAIFADCGLGKTLMQLTWAENVVRQTNKPVLIVTPIAVGLQTVQEAQKFGIHAARSSDGTVHQNITVTNYERLHHFDPAKFAGVVCDESSILKNFEGATKAAVTEFLRLMPYRLLCTATAAPNDYIEFGTSSEALGGIGYMDMLSMFFKNDQNSLHPATRTRHHGLNMSGTWRFKPHAEQPFWQWLCSWARAIRKPSDLGFDDAQFTLPPLEVRQTVVQASRPLDGKLFTLPAVGLAEQRQERRATLTERCEEAAARLSTGHPGIAWCHLNAEGDLLATLLPDAEQVSGSDSEERKEELFTAFAAGELRVLVTKSMIAGFGLNWQHCAHMTMFPSHSFEQYYQSVRRCWRFGQAQPVTVDVITTEGESDVLMNLQRKADAASRMFTYVVQAMRHELHLTRAAYGAVPTEVPAWLS